MSSFTCDRPHLHINGISVFSNLTHPDDQFNLHEYTEVLIEIQYTTVQIFKYFNEKLVLVKLKVNIVHIESLGFNFYLEEKRIRELKNVKNKSFDAKLS